MDSSPPPRTAAATKTTATSQTASSSQAGMKRSASLLPPFDPSSSPTLPRPVKRRARIGEDDLSIYPTPVPTSSTALLSSSPPRVAPSRPPMQRTHSMVSERAPLSAVPCVVLQENGEPLTMGRSSASCTYQLSSNRLISRVHVKASFKPAANPFDRDKIEILCSGWNGIKLHCQGKTYELTKGKTFTSDIRDADVMIDVQDSRVLVQWPRREKATTPTLSEQLWDDTSPLRNTQNDAHHRSLQDSPLRGRARLVSPISPSPAVRAVDPSAASLTTGRSLPSAVVVYEDAPSPSSQQEETSTDPISTSQLTQLASNTRDESFLNSIASSFSKSDELSEHDEENDPIIMSFGPYGENILPRMASFRAGASPTPRPKHAHSHSAPTNVSPAKPKAFPTKEIREAIQNHVANQLAFSRLSSTPLFTIINHLPSDIVRKGSIDDAAKEEIKVIIEQAQCMGKVTREGKDAAGKPLDPEYYYVAEFDTDEVRKQAVVNDLRKPGLRNCRKQHKQYFWRRPRTP